MEAIERQAQTVGALQELNLAHNHLGYVTHDNLERLSLAYHNFKTYNLNICGDDLCCNIC